MPRPIRAYIHRNAIRHNLSALRRTAAPAKVWAVVKANAYGHGIEQVIGSLEQADGIALLDLSEAKRVRHAGWAGPILLLEGCFEPSDYVAANALGAHVVVHSPEQLRMLETAQPKGPLPVYLKVNTGMNRLGFAGKAVRAAYQRLLAMPAVRDITLMTHFARADEDDGCEDALVRFDEAVAGLPGERCVANSAATLLHPQTRRDWVRTGIALYGSSPAASHTAADLGLQPTMTLASELIAIQDLDVGDEVGYGGHFTAERAMRLGVVACGYADGYLRGAPEGTPVAVAGAIAPLVGRVSMDMLTVDLSAHPDARVGTPVELWGKQVDIDAVARAMGTIGYELMCAVAARVPVIGVEN